MIKSYLVGGAVRDKILGILTKDNDYVVVGATEEEMLQAGFIKINASFPVFLHPKTHEEYALARIEKKVGLGYKDFSCQFDPSVTLEDDLKRRDLTINAIAFDGLNYIDPFSGLDDLKNKILKPVSNSFREDAIRVLRLARFQAKFPDFKLHDSFYSLIDDMKKNGELLSLKPERVRMEMEKAFKERKPSLFFETLKALNVLDIIFPEIHALIGVLQVVKYHPEGDAFTHTMMVLNHVRAQTADITCLYTALVHDLGKAITPKDILPQHIGHELRGIDLVKKFLKRFYISKNENFIINFTQYHLKIHKCQEMKLGKIVDLFDIFKIKKVSDDAFEKLIICSKADALGKLNLEYPQEKYLLKCLDAIEKLDFSLITKNIEESQKAIAVKKEKIRTLKQSLTR